MLDNDSEIFLDIFLHTTYGPAMLQPIKTCLLGFRSEFKPACSATKTSWKIEISPVASLDMILSNK